MLCDEEQQFTCPDTVCGEIKFSVCGYTFTSNEDDKVTFNRCADTSHLHCSDMALTSCFGLTGYVNAFGVNDTSPVGNQTVVCERANTIHPLTTNLPADIPSASASGPILEPTHESAATFNHVNFILALMLICLLTVSLSRKI